MGPRVLLVIFIVLQAADGLLTYAAVERFGPQAEGNPLLLTWIMLTGSGPALVGAKALAQVMKEIRLLDVLFTIERSGHAAMITESRN